MKYVILTLMLSALPLAGLSATTGEEDTIVINAINATDFEVIEGNSYGAAEFWCGAATYIERRTGRSELTPVYDKKPKGPSRSVAGRNSVVFSTSNAGLPAAQPTLTLTVSKTGATLKSVKARRYCRDAFTRSTK